MRKGFYQPLVLALAVLFLTATGAMATNPVVIEVIDQWKSGNAAFECRQIGAYACAYKFNEDGGEGAPNETEYAACKGLNYDWSTTITISNSTGYIFDWSSSPMGISAVIVKAGRGANVWFYDPASMSDEGLYGYTNK